MELLTPAELQALMPFIRIGSVLYITQGGGVKIPQGNVAHVDQATPLADYIIPFEQISFKDIDTVVLCHYLSLTEHPIRTLNVAGAILNDGGNLVIIENNENSSPFAKRNYYPYEMEALLSLYDSHLFLQHKGESEKGKSYIMVCKKIKKGAK